MNTQNTQNNPSIPSSNPNPGHQQQGFVPVGHQQQELVPFATLLPMASPPPMFYYPGQTALSYGGLVLLPAQQAVVPYQQPLQYEQTAASPVLVPVPALAPMADDKAATLLASLETTEGYFQTDGGKTWKYVSDLVTNEHGEQARLQRTIANSDLRDAAHLSSVRLHPLRNAMDQEEQLVSKADVLLQHNQIAQKRASLNEQRARLDNQSRSLDTEEKVVNKKREILKTLTSRIKTGREMLNHADKMIDDRLGGAPNNAPPVPAPPVAASSLAQNLAAVLAPRADKENQNLAPGGLK